MCCSQSAIYNRNEVLKGMFQNWRYTILRRDHIIQAIQQTFGKAWNQRP